MNDATAAPRADGLLVPAAAVDRRRLLTLVLLAPVATTGLAACGPGSAQRPKGPDPLVALAAAARADADLAAAAIAANPGLRARVDPLRAARTEHAAALDAEVVRAGGTPAPTPQPTLQTSSQTSAQPSAARSRPPGATTAPSGATGAPEAVTLATVRQAVAASQRGAADLVPDLPAERVGLVASVAACCAAYAAVLT